MKFQAQSLTIISNVFWPWSYLVLIVPTDPFIHHSIYEQKLFKV
jgi:hypothetical protein